MCIRDSACLRSYADVAPVRELDGGVSAFVSIMRGCARSHARALTACADHARTHTLMRARTWAQASAVSPVLRVREDSSLGSGTTRSRWHAAPASVALP
eukprot:5702011-Pleurochrysis_carterae.AAC.2